MISNELMAIVTRLQGPASSAAALDELAAWADRESALRRAAEAKLNDADRRKDEFLAMLAHELRNPLAPISMAAQILKLGPVSPARLQQTCLIIDRQISHMTSLLDDLLDVSRVTRGLVAMSKEQLDLRAIVDDALEQARPQINARGHHLTLMLPQGAVPVFGDRTRLVQVVANLLDNATKYTAPGGNIVLKLTERDDQVTVAVRDNGIGMDAGLLGRVFDLFTQGERASDRSQGGLGLGLALVKSLTERHGGTVAAHSNGSGQGSEFSVSLPRASARAEPERPRPRAVPPLRPDCRDLSVLIVDDNADAARMLAMYLQAMGHEVRTAFDGHSALALARQRFPRVMLLDIGLPDMDGYALVRSLRALPGACDALYIALTGYGQPEDRERSRDAGFDEHLTKPVDAEELTHLLARVQPLQQL